MSHFNMRSSIRILSRTFNTLALNGSRECGRTKLNANYASLNVNPVYLSQNREQFSTSLNLNQTSEHHNSSTLTNSAGYKTAQVPQDYVAAGLHAIDPVNDLLNATETKISVEFVDGFGAAVDEIQFFYEDKADNVPSSLKNVGFKGKQGQVYTSLANIQDPNETDGASPKRIVAVGLGKSNEHLRVDTFRSAIKSAYEELKKGRIDQVGIVLTNLQENIVFNENDGWQADEGDDVACLAMSDMLRLTFETLLVQDFGVEFFKNLTTKSTNLDGKCDQNSEPFRLNKIFLNNNVQQSDSHCWTKNMNLSVTKLASAVAAGQNLAKSLTQLPANICGTDFMMNQIVSLKERYSEKFDSDELKLTILSEKEMLDLGMGCLTAVGRGSDTESYLVALEYKHKDSTCKKPIVLAGKGVVHDSGGLNIKLASMDSMNKDMGGAASVIGAMRSVLDLELPTHVVGVVGLVENSVSHRCYRPGDVLRSMKGTTVEVGNTDAEGRLVLADVLYWAGKTYQPSIILDMATLTGAILVSLGLDLAGCFSNSPQLAQQLEKCGLRSFDRIHRMPLYPPYKDKLKSTVADMNNIGGPEGGSITAALFLQEFVQEFKKEHQTQWAHLDIAGAAMSGKASKDLATGRCVPLLVQFLLENTVK